MVCRKRYPPRRHWVETGFGDTDRKPAYGDTKLALRIPARIRFFVAEDALEPPSSELVMIGPEPEPQSGNRTVPGTSNQRQNVGATTPSIIDVINTLADKVDPLVKLLTAALDRYQRGQDREIRFQTHMAWIALSVVSLIVGVAGLLTYVGKIDGATFTFLLGLIVGYVLTFVRDQIKPAEE